MQTTTFILDVINDDKSFDSTNIYGWPLYKLKNRKLQH